MTATIAQASMWTEERVTALRELRERGLSIFVIAHELHAGETSVSRKIRELGLGDRVRAVRRRDTAWPLVRIERLRKMIEEGTPQSDVAAAFGVSAHAIQDACRRYGIKRVQARITRDRDRKAPSRAVERAAKTAPSPRAPPAPRQPVEAAPLYGAEALLALKRDDCKWPLGDICNPDFTFCGARAIEGRSYCPEHQNRSVGR